MDFLERLRVVGASFVIFDWIWIMPRFRHSAAIRMTSKTLAMRVPWVVLPETPMSMYEGR